MDEVVTAARAVDWSRLGARGLCDACLGRLFGMLGHGYTNAARGAAIRAVVDVPTGVCWVCSTLTSRYDDLADLVVRKIEETLKRAMPGFRECLEDMRATR